MPKKKSNNNLTNLGCGVPMVLMAIVILWVAFLEIKGRQCSGKVVDENGAPLRGATVKIHLSSWREIYFNFGSPSPNKDVSTTTDPQGNFVVKAPRGWITSLSAEHPDYHAIDASRIHFVHELLASHPQTDRLTLVLRKKLPEQNLIQRIDQLRFQMGDGSGIVFYDLKTRTLVEAESPTTLRIRTEVSPTRDQTGGRYAWKLIADVPDGSVQLKTDPYLFEAPAEGYQNSFQVIHEAQFDDWRERVEPSLFVKLKTGEFGMVDFGFDSRDGRARVLASWLNPEPGNRNLTPKFRR